MTYKQNVQEDKSMLFAPAKYCILYFLRRVEFLNLVTYWFQVKSVDVNKLVVYYAAALNLFFTIMILYFKSASQCHEYFNYMFVATISLYDI